MSPPCTAKGQIYVNSTIPKTSPPISSEITAKAKGKYNDLGVGWYLVFALQTIFTRSVKPYWSSNIL